MAVGAFINSGNPLLFSPSQRRSVSYRRCGPRVGVKRSAVRAAVPAIPALSSLPMPDPKVLQTSVKAISKLLTTLFLGVIAARRGLLEPQTLTALSRTLYNIFLPALIFTNIIRTLSSNPPAAIFLLPLIALAQVLFGFVLSKLSAKPLQLTDAESRVYTVCTTFGNSAALPLLFASALFQGADLANMVSGISFFLIGWTGLFWSIGYSILAGMPNGDETESNSKEQVIPMSTKEKITLLIKRILSPPLTAALCALVIGLIPSLRIPFTKSPLAAALQTLGTGYAPAAVLILAGSLARKQSGDNSASLLRLPRMTAGIIMSRFLILPLTTALVVKRFMPFLKSPFIILAILLEAIMPPAQNSTLILNLENRPDAASAVAKILLAVYLLGVIPISVGLTYFLGMAGV